MLGSIFSACQAESITFAQRKLLRSCRGAIYGCPQSPPGGGGGGGGDVRLGLIMSACQAESITFAQQKLLRRHGGTIYGCPQSGVARPTEFTDQFCGQHISACRSADWVRYESKASFLCETHLLLQHSSTLCAGFELRSHPVPCC